MAAIIGTSGNDVLGGFASEDQISGLAGDDRLNGGDGFDRLLGGAGNDLFQLDDVNGRYFDGQLIGFFYDAVAELADEGVDSIFVRPVVGPSPLFGVFSYRLPENVEIGVVHDPSGDPTDFDLTGNALDNQLWGGRGSNHLSALAGNDFLTGGLSFDTLAGGAGDDRYRLTDLAPLLLGGEPIGYAFDNVVEAAGEGNDLIEITALNDPFSPFGPNRFTLPANVENGTVEGFVNFDLAGNGLANSLVGNSRVNLLEGGAGNDRLTGGAGLDTLDGGTGDDIYQLEDLTPFRVHGVLLGYRYDAVRERADGGTDLVIVTAGAMPPLERGSYQLGANVENVTVVGTLSFNLFGNGLANRMVGNSAVNRIEAGAGADTVSGGGGDDWITAGSGNDLLRGQAGADIFHFDARLSATTNVDRLFDYVPADDTMLLDSLVFTGFTAVGPILQAAFRLGPAAADASDRIIYNSATGSIFFDRDGTGAAAQILFARVDPGTPLTNADFEIFGG
ncbi:MAG TPA: calcium-binding protein [Allosphingosinicella sp.]|nr:calcium-binding protein [Allosphingosinicella sp.]